MAITQNKPAKEVPANAQVRYEVKHSDLPLHCPMPGMTLWNSHPRVYLPIEESGKTAGATSVSRGPRSHPENEARCPYCGALFVLKD